MNEEETIKLIEKNCTNFVKMYKEEKSESIQINYWIGLENLIKKSKISEDKIVTMIVDNILNKQISILKSKNLIFCMLNFLYDCSKSKIFFFQNFFDLMYKFANISFEKNLPTFASFLFDICLKYFFDNNNYNEENEQVTQKQINFFQYFIENAQRVVETFLFNFLSQNKEISKNLLKKEKNIQFLFLMINSYIKNKKIKNIYNFLKVLDFSEISGENKKFFFSNFVAKCNEFLFISDKKNKYYFILILQIILPLIINEAFNNIYDEFFSKIVNFFIQNSIFDQKIIFILNQIYKNNQKVLTNFSSIYQIFIYFAVDTIITTEQLEFLINEIIPNLSSLIISIIIKKLNLTNKLRYSSKQIPEQKFKLNPEYKPATNQEDMESIENTKIIILLPYASHLHLLKKLISVPFIQIDQSSQMNLDQKALTSILQDLNSTSLNIDNASLYNNISSFIVDLLSVIIDTSISSAIPNALSIELINSIFSFISSTNIEYLTSNIYPRIIQIMRTLITSYDAFENMKDILNVSFDFLITNFAKIDQIATLILKLLVSLYNAKQVKSKIAKAFAMDKLISLCIIANSGRIFEYFFNFISEVLKTSKHHAYYSLTKYSEIYDTVLYDKLINFVMERYSKCFVDNKGECEINEEAMICISCLSDIYKKDKPEQLQKTLDVSCLKKKFIATIKQITTKITNEDTESKKDYFTIIKEVNNLKSSNIFKKDIYCEEEIKDDYIAKATLKAYSKVVAEYLHTMNTKTAENKEGNQETSNMNMIDTLFETSKEIKDEINLIFDYIDEILTGNEKISISTAIILNEIFNIKENYIYYMNAHTLNQANILIKQRELDFSHLNEIITEILTRKVSSLINYTDNQYTLILMSDAINTILSIESEKTNSNLIEKKNHVILTSIWDCEAIQRKDVDKNSNTFTCAFLRSMTDVKLLQQNEYKFIFALDKGIFNLYYNYSSINLPLVLIGMYSTIRNGNEYLKEKFIDFIYDKLTITNREEVHSFVLRLLQSKYYSYIYSPNSSKFYDICKILLTNIISYNSYQKDSSSLVVKILLNIKEKSKLDISNMSFFVKILCEVFKLANGFSKEISAKIKTDLINELNSKILPNLIIDYYSLIEKHTEYNTEYYNVLCLIYKIQSFKKVYSFSHLAKNFNENLISFLSMVEEICEVNKINELSNANLTLLMKKYDDNKTHIKFIEGLYIYILFNYKEESFNRFVNDVVLLCNDNSPTKSKFKNASIFGLFYRKNSGIRIEIDSTTFTFANFIGESLYIDAMNILNKINN